MVLPPARYSQGKVSDPWYFKNTSRRHLHMRCDFTKRRHDGSAMPSRNVVASSQLLLQRARPCVSGRAVTVAVNGGFIVHVTWIC